MLSTNYPKLNLVYFLVLLLSVVLYGNSVSNGYSIDDYLVVGEQSVVMEGVKGIPDILFNPYASNRFYTLDYRPVSLISFALEKQFFDLSIPVSHGINVLLYGILLMIVYRVLIQVFQADRVHPLLPVGIVLLYGAHTSHTEVVDSLKNRDEILAHIFGFLFMLRTYRFAVDSAFNWSNFILALLTLCLALISKVSSLPFIGIAILLVFYYSNLKKRWQLYFFAGTVLILTFAYLAWLSKHIQRETSFYENPLVVLNDLSSRLGLAFQVLIYQIRFLIFPFPLRFYYGYNLFPVKGLNDPISILSCFLHISLLLYALLYRKKQRVITFFILAYLVSTFPYSNLLISYTGIFSERSLLLSSLWFLGGISIVLFQYTLKYQNGKLQRWLFFTGILFFCMYALMTVRRNFQWKNTLTLMHSDMPFLEKSTLANLIYANNLAHLPDSDTFPGFSVEAVTYYDRAISTAPRYAEPYFQKANLYKYRRRDDSFALVNFQMAVDLEPKAKDYVYALAKHYFDLGRFFSATHWFRENYNLSDKDTLFLFYYAQSADLSGDPVLSDKINQELLQLYPMTQYPYLNIGTQFIKAQKIDSAAYYYGKAIELGCRDRNLIQDMISYYKGIGDLERASYYLQILNK